MVGVALSRMGWSSMLAKQLEEAFASRQGHVCAGVIYAWGELSDPCAANPLMRAMEYQDNYLIKTDPILKDLHFKYLRARMAMGLARLAVSLAKSPAGYDPAKGWESLIGELHPRHTSLERAVRQPTPPRFLYEQMTRARGPEARTLGLLASAYEWSELLVCLAERGEINSEAVWKQITQVLDTDLKDDELHERQSQLVQRIGWRGTGPPFAYLTLLRQRHESDLKSLAWHFLHEARAWKDFIEWSKQYLALRR